MLKYVVVLALFVAVAWADDAVAVEPSIVEGEDEVSRLFATRTTSTITTWKTSAVTTATTSCASLSNATSACRRRRGIEERPILLSLEDEEQGIKPSAIVP